MSKYFKQINIQYTTGRYEKDIKKAYLGWSKGIIIENFSMAIMDCVPHIELWTIISVDYSLGLWLHWFSVVRRKQY